MKTLKILRDFFFHNLYFSLFLTVLVAVLCFMPSENIPDTTDDKTAHFLAFGALSFSWLVNSGNVKKVGLWLSVFAIFIEIVQFLLPESFHRGFDVFDILADMVGVLLGIVCAILFNKLVK